jgi:hypothetical protein
MHKNVPCVKATRFSSKSPGAKQRVDSLWRVRHIFVSPSSLLHMQSPLNAHASTYFVSHAYIYIYIKFNYVVES